MPGRLLLEIVTQQHFWHDLRHHFASRLVRVGVRLNTARDLGRLRLRIYFALNRLRRCANQIGVR